MHLCMNTNFSGGGVRQSADTVFESIWNAGYVQPGSVMELSIVVTFPVFYLLGNLLLDYPTE